MLVFLLVIELNRNPGNHHHGNALLVIALSLFVCFIVAVIGVLLTLAATIWTQVHGPIAVPARSWIRWGCGGLLVFWAGMAVFLLIRKFT